MENTTRIFGHSAYHIPVQVIIMKEDIDLLIEDNQRKQDEFANFIAAIEKLPITNGKKLILHKGNDFIYVYKTFFDYQYVHWIKYLLLLSIAVTQANVCTFVLWCLGVTDNDKTKLKTGMCEV